MVEKALSKRIINGAIQTVLNSVESRYTNRAYARGLNNFEEWYLGQSQKLSIALYIAGMFSLTYTSTWRSVKL